MIGVLIADIGNDVFHVIETILIYASLVLTIVSLIDYLMQNKDVLKD